MLFDELHLIVLHDGPADELPPGIVGGVGVFPFVDVDGVGTKGGDIALQLALHAVDGSKDADDTEYAEGNAEQGESTAELVIGKFLYGHFEAVPDDADDSDHGVNLKQKKVGDWVL